MCSIKSITHCFARIGAVLCVVCGFATLASAQTLTLRVACYNIDADTSGTAPNPGLINPSGGGPTTSGGVLEGIGEELLSDGVAQPIDILALEETSGTNATVAPIVAGLNAYYGQYNPLDSSMYAMAPQGYLTTGTGNGPNAMVYNTKTVQLVATVAVDPLGGPGNLGSAYGEYREVMRYEFAPAGQTPTAAAEFYVYVSHYKAGTTSGDETDRNGEARIIRTNEAMLPANARVVYVGDYNPDNGSSETGYQTIIAANSPTGVAQGQGVDPLNVSGSTTIDWEDTTTNKTILFMLTEESYELRYRDDLQICTTNVYSGAAGGLALVASTYHAFGNNASLAYGSSVIANGNTALNDLAPGSHISASTLYSDLTGASDHLPVVADYTIPVVQPGAVFTAAPASGAYPSLTVTFTDASTGIVTNWFWNFGDGATSNTTTTTSVKHTYTTAGVYTVAETVTGPGGTNTNTQTGLISVSQIAPVVSWGNPAAITYGAILTSSQLNATANVPGSFAYTPTNGTVPFAGTDTLSVIFTPTNTVDYSSVTNTVSLVVSLAPLTVTASNASRQVGASNPMFIGTITGLQNNDNITATYSCAATPASPAGPYAIVPTLVDPNGLLANYSVTTNNGTLTVISIPPPNIQSVTQSNGAVTFVWVSVAGQSYQVQSSTNLTGSNWFNLGGSNVANGASTAASDSVTNTQQYYRVLLLQP